MQIFSHPLPGCSLSLSVCAYHYGQVPPYARAGLYKELLALKELVTEYRENTAGNSALRPTIAAQLMACGMYDDLPFAGVPNGVLTPETAELIADETVSADSETVTSETPDQQRQPIHQQQQPTYQQQQQQQQQQAVAPAPAAATFNAYMAKLSEYLQVLEQRLFSEGLHTLGRPPSAPQTLQYLSAYFDSDQLPQAALQAVAELPAGATLDSAVAAVRSACPDVCKDVYAVPPEAQVAMLTAEISPDKVRTGGSLEDRYESELYYGEYFRWQLLKLRRALGDSSAAAAMAGELALVQEIGIGSGDSSGSRQGGDATDTVAYALSKRVAEAFGQCTYV